MTILTVRHITTYQYKQPVSFGEHRMMLRPRESHDQRLLESKLEITPKPTNLRWIFNTPAAGLAGLAVQARAYLSEREVEFADSEGEGPLDFSHMAAVLAHG